jgi:hypothetical protein
VWILPSALAVRPRSWASSSKPRPSFVGKAVILTDGKAGTVDSVWLDDLRGLRISYPRPLWEMARFDHQIRTKIQQPHLVGRPHDAAAHRRTLPPVCLTRLLLDPIGKRV